MSYGADEYLVLCNCLGKCTIEQDETGEAVSGLERKILWETCFVYRDGMTRWFVYFMSV